MGVALGLRELVSVVQIVRLLCKNSPPASTLPPSVLRAAT
jgi:hypothetical protein